MLKDTFDKAGHVELVRWAREYFRDHATMLERAHTDEHGRIKPVETRVEIKLIRAWIDRAEALQLELDRAGAGGRLNAVLQPGATLQDALTKRFPGNQA